MSISIGMIFIFVLLAHLLYDFHWQGVFIGENKGKYPFVMFIHVLTWTLLISSVLYLCGLFAVWKLLFLFTTHMLLDSWKSKLPQNDEYIWAIYVDQGGHFLSLIAVVFI